MHTLLIESIPRSFLHSSVVTISAWSGSSWIPGSLGTRQGNTLDDHGANTFTHSFTPGGNLAQPIHHLPCFGEVGENPEQAHAHTWSTCKTGTWSCEVTMLITAPFQDQYNMKKEIGESGCKASRLFLIFKNSLQVFLNFIDKLVKLVCNKMPKCITMSFSIYFDICILMDINEQW